jgi:predicted O-methyltransferase YrrM
VSRVLRAARRTVRRLGWDVVPVRARWPRDFTDEEVALCEEVLPYTRTSPEAVVTLAAAVRHVVRAQVPGAFVECGVWKGGSAMAIARTLLSADHRDAELFLFDTFEGMTEPTEHDVSLSGEPAARLLAEASGREASLLWARAPLEAVRAAVGSVGYPAERVRFVQGPVEQTLPDAAPEAIALLRLDTDWYESTRHELEHLYPRLQPGGVLVIDDYGWWGGARKATDEFFAGRTDVPLLLRVDDGGLRIGVKPG